MFAITGITGQVGSVVGRMLLARGEDVRAIVRSPEKGSAWRQRHCDVAVADIGDPAALAKAFASAEGVFVLLPPSFDPTPDFMQSAQWVDALRLALLKTRPAKVVCLSTVGAQSRQPNLLRQLSYMEQKLGDVTDAIAFLRPAWFMENSAGDIASARDHGVIDSFLQPLHRAIPMVATADIGRVATELLLDSWSGQRIIELQGPQKISPEMIAAALGKLLGREVAARAVPRGDWQSLFLAQGMKNPLPRIQMLYGFNQGWLAFEETGAEQRTGQVNLETVLRGLIEQAH